MIAAFEVIGALLVVLVIAARRARAQGPRTDDLGRVSDQWKAQLWLRRDDPAREPWACEPSSKVSFRPDRASAAA